MNDNWIICNGIPSVSDVERWRDHDACNKVYLHIKYVEIEVYAFDFTKNRFVFVAASACALYLSYSDIKPNLSFKTQDCYVVEIDISKYIGNGRISILDIVYNTTKGEIYVR